MPIEEFALPPDDKRVAVTLGNGRSHVLDLPESVSADDAAAVIRGDRAASEVGWQGGDAQWLVFGNGQGWVHRAWIAEVTLVDYFHEEAQRVYD